MRIIKYLLFDFTKQHKSVFRFKDVIRRCKFQGSRKGQDRICRLERSRKIYTFENHRRFAAAGQRCCEFRGRRIGRCTSGSASLPASADRHPVWYRSGETGPAVRQAVHPRSAEPAMAWRIPEELRSAIPTGAVPPR